jgi:ABC-2 type transport system ATP-binding protein
VVEVQADDTRIRLVVEGTVGPTLQAAAGLEVQRIVIHEADLEDVFLSYYQEQPA